VQVDLGKQVLEFVGFFIAFCLALFLPAGTTAWAAGWIFLALFCCFYVGVTAWLYRHSPGLMQERLTLFSPEQPRWDRILFAVLLVFPFLWLAFMSFDATRFHWSPVPLLLHALGTLLLLWSFYLIFIAFRENAFASAVVRPQDDRSQVVITSGPYRRVRHPMYSGILVFSLAVPMVLGSWYGEVCALLFIALLARRAVMEEKELRERLPGYDAYAAQVRYRFVPHVW